MSWSFSRMARYVFQSKYLQHLKENDELCSDVFEKSCYLMFSKDRPLLTASSKVASESAVVWAPFSGKRISNHCRATLTRYICRNDYLLPRLEKDVCFIDNR